MSWASAAKTALRRGETVQIRPRGHSMRGRVNDGDLVTLEPCTAAAIDDIVLVCVRGRDYLHLVKDVDQDRYLIGNNRGRINGWVGSKSLFGKAIRIEP